MVFSLLAPGSEGAIKKLFLGGGGEGGNDEKLGGSPKKIEVKMGVFEKYKHFQGGYLK